ncbi:MAG: hypothetical protein EXX96DRAFT_633849 [Benjaminiella poitrasii]|nr:MAG: hypothetical protein EXX96DRAFT_633849 [Benjaminiella poitrasii]
MTETTSPPHKDVWFHIKYWKTILPGIYLISLLYMVISLMGVFHKVNDFNMDTCVKIEGPPDFTQCEDFVLDNESGIAYVGCDPIRKKYNKVMDINYLEPDEPVPHGDIWKVNYAEEQTPARIEKLEMSNVSDTLLADFHPLGMALDIHPTTGEKTLFVVNRAHNTLPSIELFTLSSNAQLIHKRSLRHPKIYSPNSLHLLNDVAFRSSLDGTPSFFFSNDHYFSSTNFLTFVLKKIENYVLYFSNVALYDARTDRVQKAISGLLFANGLTGTDETLFVAETYKRIVRQYTIVQSPTGDITLDYLTRVKFNMAVDNLHYSQGTVVVAGHPKPLDFIRYIHRQHDQKPPSQVAVWDAMQSGKTRLVLQDDGLLFATSTSANFDLENSKLIVSGLNEDGLLVCDVL